MKDDNSLVSAVAADVEPKNIDIHYSNGNLDGNFKLKFKKNLFNIIITTLIGGGSVHGVYLHFQYQDLEKRYNDQQQKVVESINRETACYKDLQRSYDQLAQRNNIPYIITVPPDPSNASQLKKEKKD